MFRQPNNILVIGPVTETLLWCGYVQISPRIVHFFVTSTKFSGMIDFDVAVNIRYGAK